MVPWGLRACGTNDSIYVIQARVKLDIMLREQLSSSLDISMFQRKQWAALGNAPVAKCVGSCFLLSPLKIHPGVLEFASAAYPYSFVATSICHAEQRKVASRHPSLLYSPKGSESRLYKESQKPHTIMSTLVIMHTNCRNWDTHNQAPGAPASSDCPTYARCNLRLNRG